MARTLFLSLAVALTLTAGFATADTCPQNTISESGSDATHQSSAPSDSLSGLFQNCQYGCNNMITNVSYNLVRGWCACNAYATGQSIGTASANTHDVFTLVGPAGAPPLTFIARASVSGGVGIFVGSATATLREGGSNQLSNTWNVPGDDSSQMLDLSVTRSTGQTFDLYMLISASANNGRGGAGDSHTSMQLSFPNLPSGYSVESCQGFTTQQPVATLSGSWGRLKTLYR